MATKKEKRQAALAKREEFLSREREIGLAALARDRAKREKEDAAIKAVLNEHDRKLRGLLAAHLIATGLHR